MLPRSAYWHHITGSQNIAEASSYAGESLQCPAPQPRGPVEDEAFWAGVL